MDALREVALQTAGVQIRHVGRHFPLQAAGVNHPGVFGTLAAMLGGITAEPPHPLRGMQRPSSGPATHRQSHQDDGGMFWFR
jgi:hypothetical protein